MLVSYSQLVDNATSVLCSLWDPRANGMSEMNAFISKQHYHLNATSVLCSLWDPRANGMSEMNAFISKTLSFK